MSVIKFDLTEDHIKLVRQLHIPENLPEILANKPFGGDNVFEDMFLILYGKPENDNLDVDPWAEQEDPWTEEQYAYMEKILNELGLALNVILYTGKFETGTYQTKTYVRDWKKIN